MRTKLFSFLSLMVFCVLFFANNPELPASNSPAKTEAEIVSEENAAFIKHHLLDSHSFDIMVDEKNNHHIGFGLPVIIYDEGFDFFMSTEFHHGEKVVARPNGKFYTLFHEKIYKTNAAGDLMLDEHHHPSVPKVLDLSITKSVLMIIIVSLFMIVVFGKMAKNYKNKPLATGLGRFLEPIVIFVRDEIALPNIGYKYKRFMSYLLTAFFFILFLNILGLTPFGVNVTGNITITFFFALMTYLVTNLSGNKDYWKHIFWMPGVPWPMKIILMPIEILGTLTKPFALMIRLFANMTAGHVVLMSLIGLVFVFKNIIAGVAFPLMTLAIYMLEILVAFLQAYIFTMLSALFIGMAVQDHEHAEHH